MSVRVGQLFDRWEVLAPAGYKEVGKNKKRFRMWECECECGTVRDVSEQSLIRGTSRSCGCWNRERSSEAHTAHGHTASGKTSSEYKAWAAMKARCYNPSNKRYADYGGRGITVDPVWMHDFEAFFEEVGPRPSPRHQIDRIDNDVGYEPGNCEWVLPHQNMTNRRNTRFVEGVPLATLAKEYGIPANTLRFRVLKGWDLDEALTVPVRRKRPNGSGRA